MAYDLILQTTAQDSRPRAQAALVAREVRQHPLIAALCEISQGPTEASDTDAVMLEEFLAEGSSEDEFRRFCGARGFSDDPTNLESAAAFLDSKWGTALTFVKLPQAESEAAEVYAALVAFAKARGLRVVDPQVGRDVDLDSPGVLPRMWR